ncbi:annexin A3-like isoform X2 [Rhinopithecus roxellana]|uniref:annexin A3-like isoform X2 n=1 Tax=Rhinopithecus roxellana TaxID=61622 RepID=UPI0012371B2D|nr:annexin A3-like isoform X2 [Rhinopithecus roxellana]
MTRTGISTLTGILLFKLTGNFAILFSEMNVEISIPFSNVQDFFLLHVLTNTCYRTDEKMLISILTERSNAQRQLIVKEYQAAYGKELKDDLKGDLSGHFEHLMVALVTPPAVFDAKQLKKSMKV